MCRKRWCSAGRAVMAKGVEVCWDGPGAMSRTRSVVCMHRPAPVPVAPLRTGGLAGTGWGWVAGGLPRSAPSGSCTHTPFQFLQGF